MPHIHEKYDFVVVVYIVHDGKVLLVNHPRYDKWIPVGGHIELDEDPEMALYREIAEETGLETEILSSKPSVQSPGNKFLLTPHGISVHEANPPHKHIGLTYFARARNDKFILSKEHSSMKWFTSGELEEGIYKLSPAVTYYAQTALETDKTWQKRRA